MPTSHTLTLWLAVQVKSSQSLETAAALEQPIGPWADGLTGSGMLLRPPMPAGGTSSTAMTPAPRSPQPPVQTGQHHQETELPCKATPPHLVEAHARICSLTPFPMMIPWAQLELLEGDYGRTITLSPHLLEAHARHCLVTQLPSATPLEHQALIEDPPERSIDLPKSPPPVCKTTRVLPPPMGTSQMGELLAQSRIALKALSSQAQRLRALAAAPTTENSEPG